MKKTLILLLCFVLTLSLAACGQGKIPAEPTEGTENAEPDAAEPLESPEPEAAAPPVEAEEEGPLVVFMSPEDLTAFSDDETTATLRYHASNPQVSFPGRQEAAERINAVLTAQNESFRASLDAEEDAYVSIPAANEYYNYLVEEGTDGSFFEPFALTQYVLLGRGDGNVLSFLYKTYTYSGGVHGYTAYSGLNFDTTTGEMLAVDSLSDDPDAFHAFCGEELLKLCRSEEYAERGLYEENTDQDVMALVRDDNWYLNKEGLVFFANAYELAPYAAGMIEFTLPYELLQGYLKDAYMPTPEEDYGGSIGGVIDEDTMGGRNVGTVRLSSDEDPAQTIVLRADLMLYPTDKKLGEFRLSHVVYSEWDNSFGEEELLWYSQWMKDDDEIRICTQIPEVIPDLAICFIGSEGEQRFALTQSGMDGSLAFMKIE